MRGTLELVDSILEFCDRHPLANLALQVAVVIVLVMVFSFILTIAIPVLLIIILLIGKFCVPFSLAIFDGLSNLFHL